jgi:hypothetical protein
MTGCSGYPCVNLLLMAIKYPSTVPNPGRAQGSCGISSPERPASKMLISGETDLAANEDKLLDPPLDRRDGFRRNHIPGVLESEVRVELGLSGCRHAVDGQGTPEELMKLAQIGIGAIAPGQDEGVIAGAGSEAEDLFEAYVKRGNEAGGVMAGATDVRNELSGSFGEMTQIVQRNMQVADRTQVATKATSSLKTNGEFMDAAGHKRIRLDGEEQAVFWRTLRRSIEQGKLIGHGAKITPASAFDKISAWQVKK